MKPRKTIGFELECIFIERAFLYLGINGHADLAGHVELIHLHKAAHPDGEHGLLSLAVSKHHRDWVRQHIVDYQRRLENHDILWQDVAVDAILRNDLQMTAAIFISL